MTTKALSHELKDYLARLPELSHMGFIATTGTVVMYNRTDYEELTSYFVKVIRQNTSNVHYVFHDTRYYSKVELSNALYLALVTARLGVKA